MFDDDDDEDKINENVINKDLMEIKKMVKMF